MSEYLIAANPETMCPSEILSKQVGVQVEHYGFDNQSHSGLIEVHQDAVADAKAFFEMAYELRFPIEKVLPASDSTYRWSDDKLMADNVSSGFNYRLIAGTNKPSVHGYGLAFDINPRQNPYIRYEANNEIVAPPGATWDNKQPGTLYKEHPLIQLMLSRGWDWGGLWTVDSGRVDYQHFELRNG